MNKRFTDNPSIGDFSKAVESVTAAASEGNRLPAESNVRKLETAASAESNCKDGVCVLAWEPRQKRGKAA